MIYGLKTKDGTRLYAVGSWENLQHKVYCAHDVAMTRLDEAFESGTAEEFDKVQAWVNTVEDAMNWVDNVMGDGLVYAPWKMRELILSIGTAYDCRNDAIAAANGRYPEA